MPRAKMISVTKAIELAKKYQIYMSRPTVIKHADREGFGHQLGKGGNWVINRAKFMGFIRGTDKNTQYNQVDSETSIEKNEEEKGRNLRT